MFEMGLAYRVGEVYRQLDFCYIGGRPQVPVGQVGQLEQLMSESPDALEPGLANEEISLFGFLALHLGQLNLEPSSPID